MKEWMDGLMMGPCRMSRSLPGKYKEEGKDITGREKSLKQKPNEMLCLWVNSITSSLLMPEVASLWRSRNSALLEKQSQKIGKKKAESSYAKEADGMECVCLLRVRGRSAQEGLGSGRRRVPAPAGSPAPQRCEAPVFGICRMPHAW